jgi:eukaryotic-like serine/threonine-protein kinase
MREQPKQFGQKGSGIDLKVQSLLGEGAMGEVFLCLDRSLDRPVVVKRVKSPPLDAVQKLALEKRFEQEVKHLASLQHHCIPRLYGYWRQEERLHLSMEWIDGIDLGVLRDCLEVIPPQLVLYIGLQLLDGLAYAHQRGIVHRDIKPTNIMINSEGHIKILDFGIARQLDSAVDERLTMSGAIIGTSAYMSPEQANGDAVCEASDLFSLGIVLLELATGKHPFKGSNRESTLMNIVQKKAPIPARLPKSLRTLLHDLLQKDSSRRTNAWHLQNIVSGYLFGTNTNLSPWLSQLYRFAQKQESTMPVIRSRPVPWFWIVFSFGWGVLVLGILQWLFNLI